MLTTEPRRTIDAIEQELLAEETIVSRARARQVELLREADAAQAPGVDGSRTLADWTAARLDLDPVTSRALATMAMTEAPALEAELSEGLVSFDRAVATAGLIAAGADETTISRSFGFAVNNVVALIARHERMSEADEREVFEGRHLYVQPNLTNTAWRLRGMLPAADGELVFEALDATADKVAGRGPDRPHLPQRRADALVTWAKDSRNPAGADKPTRSAGMATVFVDAALAARSRGEAGATTRNGVKVGPNTLHEILCSGTVKVLQECGEIVHQIGEAGTALPESTRRAVWRRDVGCTVDSCTSTYRREPHHIIFQKHGGDHRLSNLTLLCWYHHHVMIHGLGYTLDPDSPPQRRRLLPPARSPGGGSDPPRGGP